MHPDIPANLCLNCMSDTQGSLPCAACGWSPGAPASSPLYLTPGTVLHEQYVIGKVLGHGGFGITYLGWDLNLARMIAVKEYFPGGVGIRASGNPDVFAYSPTLKTDYDWGLDRYLEEARVVARFHNHPNIVSVQNFFRANGTAYIILEYLDGATFENYIQRAGGKVDWAIALRVLTPVMDALREVHSAGLLHRDISPDNIYLTRSGQVKVIDFGAARYSLGQHSKNLSVILKPGFAPPEQYQTRGNQGPWTDVYATACTFYRALTGEVPPPAPDRMAKVALVPPTDFGVKLTSDAEQALLRALALDPADRFPAMEEFHKALLGEGVRVPPPPPPPPPSPPPPDPIPVPPPPPTKPSLLTAIANRIGLPSWLVAAGGAVAALVLLVAIIPRGGDGGHDTPPIPKPGPGPKPGPVAKTARITTFEFVPDQVEPGQSTELRWSVEDATRVTLNGNEVSASGRMTVNPDRNQTVRLIAEGAGGGADRTVSVNVTERTTPGPEPEPGPGPGPKPQPAGPEIISFTATPMQVQPGQAVMLAWSIRNAKSASINPSVGPLRAPTGSINVTPRASMRYTLQVQGAEPKYVDIEVLHATSVTPPPVDPDARPGPRTSSTRGWEVYHHHGLMVPNIAIDWNQVRNPRVGVRDNNQLCLGTLVIEGNRLRFDSRTSNDGFEVELANIEKVEVNRTRIDGHATFQVKIKKGRNYNFVPRQSTDAVVNAIRAQVDQARR